MPVTRAVNSKSFVYSKEFAEAYANAKPAPKTAWEMLVLRYADGRAPCNCKQAWYTPVGQTMMDLVNDHWVSRPNDSPRRCEYGCQSNQLTCKNEIGKRVAV